MESLWWSSLIFQTSLQPEVATAQPGGLAEGTLLGRATRNDPWTAASIKTQQHGALRFLPSWHTSVTTCVDTEQCCHVTLYVAVAVSTSPRQR